MKQSTGLAGKKKNIISFNQPADFFEKRAIQAAADDRMLDALVFYRKAREKDPDNFDYAAGMADIYTELEFFEESNALIYEALRKHPKRAKECTFLMGCNFMGLSYLANADKCFKTYLEDNPNGEFIAEIENFFKFIKNDNGYADEVLLSTKDVYDYARISKARNLIANKKENLSIDIYKDILKDDPTNTVVLNDLSLAYYAKNDLKKAIKYANDVLVIDEESITALSNLIIFYRAVGDELAVAKLTGRLLDADMVMPDDFQKAAFILSWIGLYEEAYDCCMDLLSFSPHDVMALHAAAVSAYNLDSFSEAVGYWENILKIIPDNTIAPYFISLAERAMKIGAGEKLEYIFDIPEKEKKRRIKHLNLFTQLDEDRRKMRWGNSDSMLSALIWALDYAPVEMRIRLIESISEFNDDKTKSVLYRQLLKPKLRPVVKKLIIKTLSGFGEKEPFFADVDGRVDTYYSYSEIKDTDNMIGEYQDMFLSAVGYLNKLKNPQLTESFMVLYSIASENEGLKRLNPKHKNQIAAAFIYLASKRSGGKIPFNKLCKDFGVSQELTRKCRRILESELSL